MNTRLTLALMAILTNSAFASFPAPLPEFKNEKQLAEWRAEIAANETTQTTTEDTAFYTGKPYLASTNSYAFKYRNYNPELARWTSEDPSGFPDGANQNVYAPRPTSEYDYQGLQKAAFTGSWNGTHYSSTVSVTSPGEWEWEYSSDGKSLTKATGAWTGPLSGQTSCDGTVAGTIKSSIATSTFTHSGIKVDGTKRWVEIYANYTFSREINGNVNMEVQADMIKIELE
jgi:RHS repeat-associated protein